MKHFCLATLVAAAFSISPANSAPTSFFERLSGNWSGSGEAYVTKFGEISANCRVSVSEASKQIEMRGSCGTLIFRQALGLKLKNSGGNKFTGVYTGSKTGPAKLEGTLQGNRLVLNIRWGGLVNGDRTARMILERTGPNSFSQTVVDEVSGKMRSTSSFAFKRL